MQKIGTVVIATLLVAGYSTAAEAQQASNFCIGVYNKYRASPGPKAFVTGTDRSCWWAFGQKDLPAAQQQALAYCRNARRPGCRLVESAF